MQLSSFKINGVFGSKDVEIKFINNAAIIVGPNGIGKSTVANIFYYFISHQWKRLLEFEFETIILQFDQTKKTIQRNEISGLNNIEELFQTSMWNW